MIDCERLKERLKILDEHNKTNIKIIRLCGLSEKQIIDDIISDVNNILDKIDNGDIIEPVYCEDCKYYKFGECEIIPINFCGGSFYCYLGEKKEARKND